MNGNTKSAEFFDKHPRLQFVCLAGLVAVMVVAKPFVCIWEKITGKAG